MEQTNEIEKIMASICMPVYNGQSFLRKAIESALSQSHQNFEIIISDDCSQDNTENICREYANKDSRVLYIRQEKNIGANQNYNFVRKAVKGKYFTQLAQDDILENDFLSATISYMESHPECSIVSGDFESIDSEDNIKKIENLDRIRDTVTYNKRMAELFSYPVSKTFLSTYGLIRTSVRDIFFNINYPLKTVKGTEMRQLSRLSLSGDIVSIPKTLRKQRHHKSSMYNMEFNKRNTETWIIKRTNLFINLWSVRYDQAMVLMMSSIPFCQKLEIFYLIYISYIATNWNRLGRFLSKI